MSRNVNNLIRKKPTLGLPNPSKGLDGDLSIHITEGGIGLYGKVKNRWYKFGNAQDLSLHGKSNKRRKLLKQDLSVRDLDVDKTIDIGKTAITINPNRVYSTASADTDYLLISSKVFDVASASDTSKLYIGDISLQPTWGTTGATIEIPGADSAGSNHLKILGSSSTASNNDGANIYLNAGNAAGSGTDGLIIIGNNGSNTTTSELNLDSTTGVTKFMKSADANDYASLTVVANGVTTLSTFDDGGTVGHLTLDADGEIVLDSATGITKFYLAGDTDDLCTLTVAANGATTLATADSDGDAGDFILDVDGDIEFNADAGLIYIKDGTKNHFLFSCNANQFKMFAEADANDNFTITIGTSGLSTIATVDFGVTSIAHLKLVPDGDIVLDPVSQKTIINATDGLYFDGGTHTYITESGDDILDFYVGTDKMLALDEANDKITMGATNWVAGTVSAGTVTEFSATNSAYAGMILGYTRIANDGTGSSDAYISMDATLTVFQTVDSSTNVSIAFVAPPSGNVEIVFSCNLYASSKTVEFALSDNATYNEISEIHTYDSGAQSSDETDVNMTVVSWAVTGLTSETSYTYYIAGAENPTSGTAFIRHGRFRATGQHYPPIIVKAIALPATIVTGG